MRTDAQLQHDVIAELKWEPSVNASHIGVEVNNGVVTLSGHVDSYAEKWSAERAAQRVSGVKALTVELDVNLPGLNKRNDGDIALSADNVLRWTTDVPSGAVNIMVEDGWITLTGEVSWQYQRRAAASALRRLIGVKGITNKISIKPEFAFDAVKSDIENAIKRISKNEKPNITVDVKGADVTLEGTVHSWVEHDLIRNSVWSTPGVHNVIDHIAIAM
jgi:osmotically-inducible protein OsmY